MHVRLLYQAPAPAASISVSIDSHSGNLPETAFVHIKAHHHHPPTGKIVTFVLTDVIEGSSAMQFSSCTLPNT